MLNTELGLNLHLTEVAYQHSELEIKFLGEKIFCHLPDFSRLSLFFMSEVRLDAVGDKLVEVY